VEVVELAVEVVELVGEVIELAVEAVELVVVAELVGEGVELSVEEVELLVEEWAKVELHVVEALARDVKLAGESAKVVESFVVEQSATVAKSGEEESVEDKELVEALVAEAEGSQMTVTALESEVVRMLVDGYPPRLQVRN
jgi:hypothetical protein